MPVNMDRGPFCYCPMYIIKTIFGCMCVTLRPSKTLDICC